MNKVITPPRIKPIGPGVTRQVVVPIPRHDQVVTAAAQQCIGTGVIPPALQVVRMRPTGDVVAPRTTVNEICPITAIERIITLLAINHIGPSATNHGIRSIASIDGCVAVP